MPNAVMRDHKSSVSDHTGLQTDQGVRDLEGRIRGKLLITVSRIISDVRISIQIIDIESAGKITEERPEIDGIGLLSSRLKR